MVQVGKGGRSGVRARLQCGAGIILSYSQSWRAAGAVSRRPSANLLVQVPRGPNAKLAIMRYSHRQVACLSSQYDPPRATYPSPVRVMAALALACFALLVQGPRRARAARQGLTSTRLVCTAACSAACTLVAPNTASPDDDASHPAFAACSIEARSLVCVHERCAIICYHTPEDDPVAARSSVPLH